MKNKTLDTAELLFTGGDIITADAKAPYICGGALAVGGGKIIAVGTETQVRAKIASAKRSVDFSGQVMIPGLIDAHTHLFQSLGKTLGDGLTLLPWLEKFMLPLASHVSRQRQSLQPWRAIGHRYGSASCLILVDG